MPGDKPRLLIVAENLYPEAQGNLAIYARDWAALAVQAGWDVTVAAADPGFASPQQLDGFRVLRYAVQRESKINYYLSCIRGMDELMTRLLAEEPRFDLIHFFHHISALGARLNGKLKKHKMIFTHLGSMSNEYLMRDVGRDKGAGYREKMGLHIEGSIFPLLMDNIEAKNFSRCGFVMTPTAHLRELVLKEKVKKDRVVVIHPGVDTSLYNADLPKPDALKSASHVFGFCAEMTLLQGADLYVELAGYLSKLYPKAIFFAAGNGVEEPGLKLRVKEMGFGSRFHWLSPKTEIYAPWLRHADLMLSPSFDEQIPMAMLQAWSAGCPVAAFQTPGLDEYLSPGENGIFAEKENIDDMLRKIKDFLDHRPNGFGNDLRAQAVSYDWKKIAPKILECYKKVTG